MPKTCQNCGDIFKIKQIIDGKVRVMSNRKLCLKCSPFGSQNTRPTGTITDTEKEELHKRKVARLSLYVSDWRRRTKLKLIAYKGGKCERCGYSKPFPSVYDFHHKDPTKKDFGLGEGSVKAFARMKKEADKCALLCKNCHAEVHEEQRGGA
jgi:predicted HNH restriction endonuclease